MRVRAVFLGLVVAAIIDPAISHAEKVRTNASTRVYSRPGEQSTVVVKVKSGQTMTVLAKDGRWIKVRVSGRTGFVPRSKVDLPDGDDEITRNTRRRPFVDGRGTKRGFGGEAGPEDRVGGDATGDGTGGDDGDDGGEKPKKPKHTTDDDDGDKHKKPHKHTTDDDDDGDKPKKHASDDDDDGDKPKKHASDDEPTDGDEAADERLTAHVADKTTIYSEPNKDSDKAFVAHPNDVLYPEEKKGKWTFVSNDDGDAGYILTSRLDIDDGAGGGKRVRILDVGARLGVTLLNQGTRTVGSTVAWPDNYNAGSSALTVAIGGAALFPYAKDYYLGGELAYDYDKAVPGIAFKGATTGFTLHNLNVRAVAGYDLHKKNGMVIFGRLGFHYQAFQVDNYADPTKNTALLPEEVMKAPTIGAALAIPRLTDTIGIRASVDAAVAGASLTQTKNLEDGASPSAKTVCLGAAFTYRWKPQMDLQATYDLNYESISFGAPLATSMRNHMGTSVSRTDVYHTVSFGIVKGF